MRIIELLIDKLEEFNGFDAVALVEEPAIELDFFAFNNKEVLDTIKFEVLKLAMKEKFVERLPGVQVGSAPSQGLANLEDTSAPQFSGAQPAIRTYVLSGDVTSAQEADSKINKRRTVG